MRFLTLVWVLLGAGMLHGADRLESGRCSLEQLYKDYASEADLHRLLAQGNQPSPLHRMLREKTEGEKLRDLGAAEAHSGFSTSPCMQYMVLMELTVLGLVAGSKATRDTCRARLAAIDAATYFPLVRRYTTLAFSMFAAPPPPRG